MAVAISNTAQAVSSSSATGSRTWTGTSFGTAADDRLMVVSFCMNTFAGSVPSLSCTIGGVAGTSLLSARNNSGTTFTDYKIETFLALVPSGTTGTTVLSGTNVQSLNTVAVFTRVTGADATPSATLGPTANANKTISGSLTIPTDGAGLGVVGFSDVGVTGYAWTNLTEQTDASAGNLRVSSATSTSAGTSSRQAVVSTSEDAADVYQVMNLIAFQVPVTGQPAVKRMGGVPFVGNRGGQNTNLWREQLVGWRKSISGLLLPPKPSIMRV